MNTGAGAAPRVIPAPVIEDVPGLMVDGHVGQQISSSNLFLALGPYANILWIRISGFDRVEGSPVNFIGRELVNYPAVRCDVYSRDRNVEDPVEPVWWREEQMLGHALFLGVNYPFILNSDPAFVNAADALPVFRSDCVFVSHRCFNQFPRPFADWCRIPLNGDATFGSSIPHAVVNWGEIEETPMWFVPRIPEPVPDPQEW